MAQITKLVDDLDGTDAEMTLEFGLDGTEYAIDLNDPHYEEYRKVLELLASKGRVVTREPVKVKRTLSTGKKTSVVGKTQEMREWLRANGHNVSDRGRVPTHLVDLYETRPRGPVAVKGDEKVEGGENGTAGKPEVQDEDAKAEQAVIARVKNTPKAAPTTRRKPSAKDKGVEVEIPALRKVLSLVGGE